jgi:Phage P22-like portal protein
MAKKDKLFDRAKERIEEAKESLREQHQRIKEDLRFSNPAAPEQWGRDDLLNRTGRASLTLDRTNQFIQQVVNDARQSNPGVRVLPVDSRGDVRVADALSGMFRHIEYSSRAGHAYDTAIDMSARCGLGWLRVYPVEVDSATGEQEIRIGRIIDPCAAGLDPNSTEADGSDAEWGYVETAMTDRAFRAAYPKAKAVTFSDGGWRSGDKITVCEYFEIESTSENMILALDADGVQSAYTEEEFWQAKEAGEELQPIETKQATKKRICWVKMTGAEVLEKTEFPGEILPIVPVLGYELWVDGARNLCGLTRRLMDGQRLHNFQMSAVAEFLASQPKAPFMVPVEAVEGHEEHWKKLHRGNPAWLPYNAVNDDGQPIPQPQRMMPPPMPGAYAQMAEFAVAEMEASVGMYKANLGQHSNETSGRAIRARQMEGDTATFHFIDNLSRSIEQLARVIVGMIPLIYTSDRIARIVGADGEHSSMRINPTGPAVQSDRSGKLLSINPGVGRYDVRVQTGPSYTTQREETAQQLSDMIQAQPALAPVLGPMWAKLKDMPEADKIARLLLAMAPPQVQQMQQEEDGQQPIPPQIQAKLQAAEQQAQQMHQMIYQASAKLEELHREVADKRVEHVAKAAELEIREYEAETKRMQVMGAGMTPAQVQQIVMQLMQDMAQTDLNGAEPIEPAAGMQDPGEQMQHEAAGPPQFEQAETPEMGDPQPFSLGVPAAPGPDLGRADPMTEGQPDEF